MHIRIVFQFYASQYIYTHIIVQFQDSVGAGVATPNMAQNTEHTFIYSQEANSSSMGGNPPQLAVNDANQLPLFSPSTSAPLLDPDETESNCYVPSMVTIEE